MNSNEVSENKKPNTLMQREIKSNPFKGKEPISKKKPIPKDSQENKGKFPSNIPKCIKRPNNLITKTPEKNQSNQLKTADKLVASSDEELLKNMTNEKIKNPKLELPSTEKKTQNKRQDLKFATEIKFNPKCATGIPWIVPKKTTKAKPFNFASDERAKRRIIPVCKDSKP